MAKYERVGGYVLVDGTGIDESTITTDGTKVEGIFKKFHDALKTNKPAIVENVINGDNAYGPFDITLYGDDLAVQAALGSIVVRISADDEVTLVSNT